MELNNLIEVQSVQTKLNHLHLAVSNELEMRSCYGNEENGNLLNIPLTSINGFNVPSEDLTQKIIQQVELLFSDVNIQKDKFLLKHIRRNKDGYVSLKLISSLRKVKALTKDWKIVAYSLRKSRKLQINEDMTKIRRIDPLPALETSSTSKVIILFNLLPNFRTIEFMQKLINKLGTVTSIKFINSATDVSNKIKEAIIIQEVIATFPLAVVVFGTPKEASNAILRTTHSTSILKIIPIKDSEDIYLKDNPLVNEHDASKPENMSATRKKPVLEETKSGVHPKVDICFTKEKRKNADKNKSCSPLLNGRKAGSSEANKNALLPCEYRGDCSMNNSWFQRRHISGIHKEPRVMVLRQPKGPDGTRGFYQRRSIAAALLFKTLSALT